LAVKAGDTVSDGKKMMTVISDLTGEELLTREDMYIYKCFFEKMVAAVSIPCINATEGGAGIKGTQVMTFADVIARYASRPADIAERIGNVFSAYCPNPPEEIAEGVRLFREQIRDTRAAAKSIVAVLTAVLARIEVYGLDRTYVARELSRVKKAGDVVAKHDFLLRVLHAQLLKNILQQKREGAVDEAFFAKKTDAEFVLSLKEDIEFQQTLITALDQLDSFF